MEGLPLVGAGINGVRYRAGFLYYTNTSKCYLARIPIDPITARLNGGGEILVKNLPRIDGFALGRENGEFFVALELPHSKILRIKLGEKEKVIASTKEGIEFPTSVQFGRTAGKENTIYVTTSGNPLPIILMGVSCLEKGKAFAIDL